MKKTTYLLIVSLLFSTSLFADVATKTTMLEDLGIHYDEEKITDEESEKFTEERAWKLNLHPTMGHITAGLMAASVFTALMARNRDNNRGRTDGTGPINFHRGLSYVTALSYYYTGYLSLTAPKPVNFEDGHDRKLHKHMAYIHVPMMILAPILGTIAYSQRKKYGETRGIGKMARPAMYLGAAAFFTAWGVMTF